MEAVAAMPPPLPDTPRMHRNVLDIDRLPGLKVKVQAFIDAQRRPAGDSQDVLQQTLPRSPVGGRASNSGRP